MKDRFAASDVTDLLLKLVQSMPHIDDEGVSRSMRVHAPAWTAMLKLTGRIQYRIVDPKPWISKPPTEKLVAGDFLREDLLASHGLSFCRDFDQLILRMLLNKQECPNLFVGMKPINDEVFWLKKDSSGLNLQVHGCGPEIDFGIGGTDDYLWVFRVL